MKSNRPSTWLGQTARKAGGLLLLSVLLISLIGCGQKNKPAAPAENNAASGSAPIENKAKSWAEMPKMSIDTNANYVAEVKTTKGTFEIELFAKEAPQTVNNFVFLANEHYYDGITFHRIIETFMVQSGDPLGNGMGGPGYTIPDELDSKRSYEPGVVAMAKSSQPNSAGSQFFICTGDDAGSLNMQPVYPIFGKVKSGMDVVTAIAKTPVVENPDTMEQSKPQEVVKIETVTIHKS
ncbi:peptidylprolyl isomerase [Paenibacillus sp. ACRRX]|uniref:peptidylprolyl isomerase n=1 Tax=Paenibacillus sp. ACRRX TaxID=2918206 RepID=UPI001EF70F6D|nr:peptidylprolyl isomerase [Paenibacillus sp. ACRRX]MCG7406726.1 peptidylprolyl isomerase [Paenibacillus sp. ACRRX]